MATPNVLKIKLEWYSNLMHNEHRDVYAFNFGKY